MKKTILTLALAATTLFGYSSEPLTFNETKVSSTEFLTGTVKGVPINVSLTTTTLDSLFGSYYSTASPAGVFDFADAKRRGDVVSFTYQDADSKNRKVRAKLSPREDLPLSGYSTMEYSYSGEVPFTGEESGATEVTYSVEKMVFSGESIIADSLNAFLDSNNSDLEEYFAIMYNDNIDYIKEEGNGMMALYMYMDQDVEYISKDVVSISIESDMYAGGAHGISPKVLMTFDVKSGSVLKVADIIKSQDDPKLLELLREKLIEYTGSEDHYFSFDQIRLTDNFNVLPSGIQFTYFQYEIASYAAGRPSVFFTFEELAPFLKVALR